MSGDRSDGIPAATNEMEILRNRQLIDLRYTPTYISDMAVQSCGIDTIRLGLCCLNTVLRDRNIFCSRTCRLDTFTTKGFSHIAGLVRENLSDLLYMLKWNEEHNIKLMRISSDIFPHKSNHRAEYYDMSQFQDELTTIGEYARAHGHRLTFHPGQYNVVATPDEDKFQNTIRDLDWHAEMLDRMGCGVDSVMVVHGGGTYGDKEKTKRRWVEQFARLPERVRRRLVLENCEKNFSVEDCLSISDQTGVPVVFDTHHYDCYKHFHPDEVSSIPPARDYMPRVLETWHRRGIRPKFHISQQRVGGPVGAHSDYIDKVPDYLLELNHIDIMVEAKMKEQAVFQLRESMAAVTKPSVIKLKLRPRPVSPVSPIACPRMKLRIRPLPSA
jgi:UV DNA damage endonuclease